MDENMRVQDNTHINKSTREACKKTKLTHFFREPDRGGEGVLKPIKKWLLKSVLFSIRTEIIPAFRFLFSFWSL